MTLFQTLFPKFLIPVVLFALTLVSGFIMSRMGKPLNGVLFNVHKLIALGAVVLSVVQLVNLPGGSQSRAMLTAALALGGLCVLALFVSGALMSIGRLNYTTLHIVHAAVSVLLAVAFGFVLKTVGEALQHSFFIQ